MNRRHLLSRACVSIGLCGLAGCLGNLAPGDRTIATSNDGAEGPSPPFETDEDPYERYTIGDPTDDIGHEVYVRNAGSDERSITLEAAGDDGGIVETVDVPAGAYLEVLSESTALEVMVETDESRSETTVGGSGGRGHSRTVVTVRETGLETSTVAISESY
ncbi:hypothetical protein ACYJ1Y_03210 [Natrialbaceae archaeon A-gly3]